MILYGFLLFSKASQHSMQFGSQYIQYRKKHEFDSKAVKSCFFHTILNISSEIFQYFVRNSQYFAYQESCRFKILVLVLVLPALCKAC